MKISKEVFQSPKNEAFVNILVLRDYFLNLNSQSIL